jgi:hypothetical protein
LGTSISVPLSSVDEVRHGLDGAEDDNADLHSLRRQRVSTEFVLKQDETSVKFFDRAAAH